VYASTLDFQFFSRSSNWDSTLSFSMLLTSLMLPTIATSTSLSGRDTQFSRFLHTHFSFALLSWPMCCFQIEMGSVEWTVCAGRCMDISSGCTARLGPTLAGETISRTPGNYLPNSTKFRLLNCRSGQYHAVSEPLSVAPSALVTEL